MSVALELVAAARRQGDEAVMVPTGQTGMMIEGWGVAVDRVISDFLNGTVEWLVEQGEERGDWVIVEGHSPKNWGLGGKPWPVDEMPPGPSS